MHDNYGSVRFWNNTELIVRLDTKMENSACVFVQLLGRFIDPSACLDMIHRIHARAWTRYPGSEVSGTSNLSAIHPVNISVFLVHPCPISYVYECICSIFYNVIHLSRQFTLHYNTLIWIYIFNNIDKCIWLSL